MDDEFTAVAGLQAIKKRIEVPEDLVGAPVVSHQRRRRALRLTGQTAECGRRAGAVLGATQLHGF